MKISVVIVEYQSLDEIKTCIKSYKSSIPEIEIIVSSNSRYDTESQENIVAEYPNCKWCFNEKNGGFAYAMNEGLKIATGDYLVISNPDCIVQSGINEMAEFLKKHSEVGAVAPQLIDEEGNIQDSCRRYVTPFNFIGRQLQRISRKVDAVLDDRVNYHKIQTVDWVIGAFIMVTRGVYEKTRGLSQDYFMYVEDADWCTRIRQCGYEIVYYPKATVIYKGSRKARTSLKYAVIFLRSLMIYWKKFGFFKILPSRVERIYNDDGSI